MPALFNTTIGGNWPAGERFEYVLAGCPDNGVSNRIIAETAIFAAGYNQPALLSRPQINLASFIASEAMEPTIIRWLQRIFGAQQGFSVTLNNYGGFPPDTLCLRVQDPHPFNGLAKKLQPVDEFIRASHCPPLCLHERLHLRIAAQLTETVYNKAMADYARKTFHASFVMDELLLQRRSHPFDNGKTIHIFRLLPAGNDMFSCVAR